ncbi:MAG: hypothetical protein ACK56I_22945, partial [bacterium]
LRREATRRELGRRRQQQTVVRIGVVDDPDRVAEPVADPRVWHRGAPDQHVVRDQAARDRRAVTRGRAAAGVGERHGAGEIGGHRDLSVAVARTDRLRVAEDDAHPFQGLEEIEAVAARVGRMRGAVDGAADVRRDQAGWRAARCPDAHRRRQRHVARDALERAALE